MVLWRGGLNHLNIFSYIDGTNSVNQLQEKERTADRTRVCDRMKETGGYHDPNKTPNHGTDDKHAHIT